MLLGNVSTVRSRLVSAPLAPCAAATSRSADLVFALRLRLTRSRPHPRTRRCGPMSVSASLPLMHCARARPVLTGEFELLVQGLRACRVLKVFSRASQPYLSTLSDIHPAADAQGGEAETDVLSHSCSSVNISWPARPNRWPRAIAPPFTSPFGVNPVLWLQPGRCSKCLVGSIRSMRPAQSAWQGFSWLRGRDLRP